MVCAHVCLVSDKLSQSLPFATTTTTTCYYYYCYYYYSFNVHYFRAYTGQTFSPRFHTSTSLGPLPSLALAPYPSCPHPNVLSKSSLACPYLCCPPLPSSYKRSPADGSSTSFHSTSFHLLPLDMPEPPQSTSSHNIHHTLNSKSSP